MKSKNAKWWLVIAPLLFAYSAACLFITPQLCPMPEAGALTQRYAAPAVAEPRWQAVKTLASGTLGTACSLTRAADRGIWMAVCHITTLYAGSKRI